MPCTHRLNGGPLVCTCVGAHRTHVYQATAVPQSESTEAMDS